MNMEPHTVWCPKCRHLASVVYLGGWIRIERCDYCKWYVAGA